MFNMFAKCILNELYCVCVCVWFIFRETYVGYEKIGSGESLDFMLVKTDALNMSTQSFVSKRCVTELSLHTLSGDSLQ